MVSRIGPHKFLGLLGAASLALTLPACGDAGGMMEAALGGGTMNISEGPDICFKTAFEKIGSDAKIFDATAMFSPGEAIDASAMGEAGSVVTCQVSYQNPDDPRKLLAIQYAGAGAGIWQEEIPTELDVDGPAEDFTLDDVLIAQGDINAAAAVAQLENAVAELDAELSSYAITMLRVQRSRTNGEPSIYVQMQGRLASNDLQQDGYIETSLDGSEVYLNQLAD